MWMENWRLPKLASFDQWAYRANILFDNGQCVQTQFLQNLFAALIHLVCVYIIYVYELRSFLLLSIAERTKQYNFHYIRIAIETESKFSFV